MKKDLFNKLKLYIEENVELVSYNNGVFKRSSPSNMIIENSEFENFVSLFIKLEESEYNKTFNHHLNEVSAVTFERYHDIIKIELEVFDYVLEWLKEETVFEPGKFQVQALELFVMHYANYFEKVVNTMSIIGDWRYDSDNNLHLGVHTTDMFVGYERLRKIFNTTSLKVMEGEYSDLIGFDITLPVQEIHALFNNVSVLSKNPYSKLKDYAALFVERHFDIKGSTNN